MKMPTNKHWYAIYMHVVQNHGYVEQVLHADMRNSRKSWLTYLLNE